MPPQARFAWQIPVVLAALLVSCQSPGAHGPTSSSTGVDDAAEEHDDDEGDEVDAEDSSSTSGMSSATTASDTSSGPGSSTGEPYRFCDGAESPLVLLDDSMVSAELAMAFDRERGTLWFLSSDFPGSLGALDCTGELRPTKTDLLEDVWDLTPGRQLAVGPDGRTLAAWNSAAPVLGPMRTEIHVRLFDIDGAPLTETEVDVPIVIAGEPTAATPVALIPVGDEFVLFATQGSQHREEVAAQTRLFHVRLSANGDLIGPRVGFAPNWDEAVEELAVVGDDERFAAAWTEPWDLTRAAGPVWWFSARFGEPSEARPLPGAPDGLAAAVDVAVPDGRILLAATEPVGDEDRLRILEVDPDGLLLDEVLVVSGSDLKGLSENAGPNRVRMAWANERRGALVWSAFQTRSPVLPGEPWGEIDMQLWSALLTLDEDGIRVGEHRLIDERPWWPDSIAGRESVRLALEWLEGDTYAVAVVANAWFDGLDNGADSQAGRPYAKIVVID